MVVGFNIYEDEDWGSDEMKALDEEEGAYIQAFKEEDVLLATVLEMFETFQRNPIHSSSAAVSKLVHQLGISRPEAWERIRSEALYRGKNNLMILKILQGMTSVP